MSDKIVVPFEMLKAATVAYNAKTHEMGYKYVIDRNVTEATLEAALRWLVENPIEPSGAQALTLLQERVESGHLSNEEYCAIPAMTISKVIVAWQKRMFSPEEGD